MLPGDRLVCAFVDPVTVGDCFTKWLLHVTVIPWFRLDDSSGHIAAGLQMAMKPIEPFAVKVGEEVMLGPKKNRPAHLIEPGSFPEVETRVRNYLHKKQAWLVDETTRRKQQFRPHVTIQGDRHLEKGSELHFDAIYIVEQKGLHKEIVADIKFNGSA
jgi:2'-5' RNA ligase